MSSLLVFTPINLITYSTGIGGKIGHRNDAIEVQKSNIYFYCHVYAHTLHLCACICI